MLKDDSSGRRSLCKTGQPDALWTGRRSCWINRLRAPHRYPAEDECHDRDHRPDRPCAATMPATMPATITTNAPVGPPI